MYGKIVKPARLPDAIESVQSDSENKVEQKMNRSNQPVSLLFPVKMDQGFILPGSDQFHRNCIGFRFDNKIPGPMMPGIDLAERGLVIITCQDVSNLAQHFIAFSIREEAAAVFIIPEFDFLFV